MQITELKPEIDIYTVSRLNNEVRYLLEESFSHVWVEGEISNFAAPGSGHWYFSLKDAGAQVRCCMFKGNQRNLGFLPKDGMHILIKAKVSLYPNRGDYQLIAEFMEERGEGKLRRAYELLKKKLEAAGLFKEEHKKAIPVFPRQIGVVTSSTGAAIRDILTVLKRRFASVPVIIYPTLVQGNTAAPTIVQAIETANQRNECDVLILARGGGSLEDLWPFNEEMVAHAIFASKIPIISAIGHEVDFTIADYVADKRAPTPSAAAELVTPDKNDLLQTIMYNKRQIWRHIQQRFAALKEQIVWIEKNITQHHPKRKLAEKVQRLDYCELHLVQLQSRLVAKLRSKLQELLNKLHQKSPARSIQRWKHALLVNHQQLTHATTAILHQHKLSLANAAAKLDALSPLATLQRGYAIAIKQDQQILRDAEEVKKGDLIQVRVQKGMLDCVVKDIQTESVVRS